MSTTEQPSLDLTRYVQVSMCTIDPHGLIISANAAFLDLVGATQEDIQQGLSLHEFMELPRSRNENDQKVPLGQWTMTFERELCCRDGKRFPVQLEFSPLENATDRYLTKVFDLVAHQRAQREALLAAAIIGSSDDAIISKDLDGIIVSWNAGAEKLYGYSASEVIGRSISLLIPPDLADDFPHIMRLLQQGKNLTHHETTRIKKDGTRVPVSITFSPIRESSGKIIGASSVAHDITERRQMEDMISKNQELMQQYRRSQEVNRLKSEFLANMSHELRTPLNAIIGFSELIYDELAGPITEEQKDYLGDVLSSSKHLLRLITDVLDLAKIEAGKMTFLPEPVILNDLVDEVCNILRPLTADKQLSLDMKIDAQLGKVTVDPAKLKQVLYNYLSNAIKFTPPDGQIMLRLQAEGPDFFRLEVEDNGVGINPEDLRRLFVEFQQLDGSMIKHYQGTGLGLALTKRIVEAQGGRVGVHSVFGQGSTFFAILPRIAIATPPLEEDDLSASMLSLANQTERPDASSVLIVEDEPKDRRPLIQAFTNAGYRVEVASTGTQAVAQCRQRRFDVITLDLLLPDLSGWEVLRAIRREGLNCEVPVIIVTLIAEKEIGMGFPIHEILNKPVQMDELFASLERAKLEKTNNR
ncbi:MAG TPA: PAS domain S-box protein [Ktedonobacteraceae bacterium]|nr:PAS domain S-box protein [Ktedonobacteraceae bacterium]